jgi:hypothetical protein
MIIEKRIFVIRGQKVMLDSDLAELYGVETRRLNEQVRRNLARFPEDFMFQLTPLEFESLMSQIATSKSGRGGRQKQPLVFTEAGVGMLSSVLSSERAIQVNIAIIRTFTKLRSYLAMEDSRLEKLENKTTHLFRIVFERLDNLATQQPIKRVKRIGLKG